MTQKEKPMMCLDIPGAGKKEIQHIVFDYNGTIAIDGLGPENTLSVGNGANDVLMLKHAAIGIAVMQDEGVASAALLAADLVVKNILDLFAMLNTPERIMATLRN